MLKCETNTCEIKKRIKKAFKELKGNCTDIFFEHGQWFVFQRQTEKDKYWSVVDAEGPKTFNGFDFEELS